MVVLPDYQGIGIGVRFTNEVTKEYIKGGWDMNLTTTTPALVHALARSKEWALVRKSRSKTGWDSYHNSKNQQSKHLRQSSSDNRITYSFNWQR